MGGLPIDDPGRAAERLAALADIGVTRFVTGVEHGSEATPFQRLVEGLHGAREALAAGAHA
jgi:hypothetical protein